MLPTSQQKKVEQMDQQNIINTLLGLVCGGLGWFSRELWAAVKELKNDLSKLREGLPSNYVQKDDFKESMKEIKDMLGKIFDHLDNKADK